MTITEFLRARIAEDEQAANEATDGPWRYDPTKVNAIDRGEAVFAGETGANATTIASTGPPYDMQSMFDAVHIARHDPARVLAGCEAKRKIIAFHESWPTLVQMPAKFEPIKDGDLDNYTYRMSQEIAWLTTREYVARFGIDPPTAPMLAALALIYSDHPDYDEEWRA